MQLIELIIVDDKANDDSPNLLNNNALNDKRITIILKNKNEMTGYARNSGLDFVMGEYLGFLDYDDLFHKNALLFEYSEAKKKNSTIVNFKFKKFKDESSIINELNDLNDNYIIEIVNENNNYPI